MYLMWSYAAPKDLVFDFDRLELGPSFPTVGGLIVTFPSFELAVRLTIAMEQSPDQPKIIMLPNIFVS